MKVILYLLFVTSFIYANESMLKKYAPIDMGKGIITFIPYSFTPPKPCKEGYDLVYALIPIHSSGNIESNSNKIIFKKICQNNDTIKDIKSNIIGTFKDKPDLYKIYYSTEDKPPNGYDRLEFYSGTKYNGLLERYMFASDSQEELVSKVNRAIKESNCRKWASNYSGGLLNRDDNFWTYFCPKKDLVEYLNNNF